MIGYLDWAQAVIRAVLAERPSHTMLTIGGLAEDLGLPFGPLSDTERNDVTMAIDNVLRDLAPYGLVTHNPGGYTIEHPPEARRYRIEPLSSKWSEMRAGYLAPDEEAYLSAVARLSEKPGERMAEVVSVPFPEVFAELGWDYDWDRAFTLTNDVCGFVQARMYGGGGGGIRIAYAGLVRVLDVTGALLREAEDHLQAQHLRAAGCVAAVELERRLKELVAGRPMKVSGKRDPSLDDYNRTAFEADLIDQETMNEVRGLAVIRKRCVHVMDTEPDADEVGRLLAGVERILRRYPKP